MNIKKSIYRYAILSLLPLTIISCCRNSPSEKVGTPEDGLRVSLLAAPNLDARLRSHDAGLSINKDVDSEDAVQRVDIFSNSSSDVAVPMTYDHAKWGQDAPYVVFKKRFDPMPPGQQRDVILVANFPGTDLANQDGRDHIKSPDYNLITNHTNGYIPLSPAVFPPGLLMVAHLKNLNYTVSEGLTATLVNSTAGTEDALNLSNGDPIILERAVACVDVVIKNDIEEPESRGINIVPYSRSNTFQPAAGSFYIKNYPNKIWYLPLDHPLDKANDYYMQNDPTNTLASVYYKTSIRDTFLRPFLYSLSGQSFVNGGNDKELKYKNLAPNPKVGLLIKPARIYIPENYPADAAHQSEIHIKFQKNVNGKIEKKLAVIPFGTYNKKDGFLHIERNVHYTVTVTIISWGRSGKLVLNVRVFRNKWETNEVTLPTFK